jgi:hypothetical protein
MRKRLGKRPLESPRTRCSYSIEMDLRKVGSVDGNCGAGSFPVAGFETGGAEPSGSNRELDT